MDRDEYNDENPEGSSSSVFENYAWRFADQHADQSVGETPADNELDPSVRRRNARRKRHGLPPL